MRIAVMATCLGDALFPQVVRATVALLQRAGVAAVQTAMTPSTPALSELTAARRPSGDPVPVRAEPHPAPRRSGPGAPARADRSSSVHNRHDGRRDRHPYHGRSEEHATSTRTPPRRAGSGAPRRARP